MRQSFRRLKSLRTTTNQSVDIDVPASEDKPSNVNPDKVKLNTEDVEAHSSSAEVAVSESVIIPMKTADQNSKLYVLLLL